jgi:hypothetical protein
MKLQTFLSDPRRSSSREYILTTRLVHDLTVAAAARGYDLLVYLPTVDSDGFDVILDDRDRLVPIQIKSIVKGGRARGWKIRRTLIRPEPEAVELYGFESSPHGVGRAGGVILTTVAATSEATVDVTYAYTDIDILSMMWMDIIPRSPKQKEGLRRLRNELESDPHGSVELPRYAFLRVSSPEHLLALAGLLSRVDNPLRLQLRKLLVQRHFGRESDIPDDTLRANLRRYVQELSPEFGWR